MENYWNECKKHTGAHMGREGVKTAEQIGVKGAWTLKSRGRAKILVGCVFRPESEWAEKSIKDEKGSRVAEHLAVCEHKVAVGASTRRVAIDRAKVSDKWCDKCSTRAAAV